MADMASGPGGQRHVSGGALVRFDNRAAGGNAFVFRVSLELPRRGASPRHRAALVAGLETTHATNGTDLCRGAPDLMRMGVDYVRLSLAAVAIFSGSGRRLPKFDQRSRALVRQHLALAHPVARRICARCDRGTDQRHLYRLVDAGPLLGHADPHTL